MRYWIKYIKAWAILQKKSLLQHFPGADNLSYTRFVIVCTSRTGSTWLHTLLNSHPHIISVGEIINKYHKKGQYPPLEKMAFHGYSAGIDAVGLKIFYGDESSQYDKYLKEVSKNHDIKIIHMVRKDQLAQYTSLKISERNWEWTGTNRKGTFGKITLSPKEFKRFIKDRQEAKREMEQVFKNHEVLTVSYEDLNFQHDSTVRLIQEFLNVKPKKLFSVLRKQSSGELQDQIENWSDFEKFRMI